MADRPYQQEINGNTLYEIHKDTAGAEQLAPTIEVIGTAVDIFVSQTQPASAPAGMTVIENGNAFTGTACFEFLANYIYVQGSPTSIVLSGIRAEEVTP